MSLIMWPFRRRRQKTASMTVRTSGKIGHDRETDPSNVPLVFAIVVGLIFMIGLTYLNLCYVMTSSPTLEMTHPSLPALTDQSHATEDNHTGTLPKDQPIKKPNAPEVTFYERLTSQDKTHHEPAASAVVPDSNPTGFPKIDPSPTRRIQNTKKKKRAPEHAWKAPATSNGRAPKPKRTDRPSQPTHVKKRYTVLIGTFSQPTIAERRSRSLKSKGYHVKLKPVAKPGKGVLYQIWSAKFSSEAQAKSLANRLQSSEGLQKVRIVAVN